MPRDTKCTVYDSYCSKHDMSHGEEAEKLRVGIELLIKKSLDRDYETVHVSALQDLLDEVDAGDSLAYLESRVKRTA